LQLSIDDFFTKSTMRVLSASYGLRRAREARERMVPIIARAKKAEAEGRIADMWPSLVHDSSEEIRAGQLTLVVIYRPVTDGKKGPRQRWSTTILHPETETHDRPPEAKERAAVEG